MSSNGFSHSIVTRRDTKEEWERINPVLLASEEGLEVESIEIIDGNEVITYRTNSDGEPVVAKKIGNGVDRWNDLPYSTGPMGPKGEAGDKGDKGDKGDPGPSGDYPLSSDKEEDSTVKAASTYLTNLAFDSISKIMSDIEPLGQVAGKPFISSTKTATDQELNFPFGGTEEGLLSGTYYVPFEDMSVWANFESSVFVIHICRDETMDHVVQIAIYEDSDDPRAGMSIRMRDNGGVFTDWAEVGGGGSGAGVPPGTILNWWGDARFVPEGFLLCDGTNGTPNTRNRVIIGAGDVYEHASTGGRTHHTHGVTVNPHTLTIAQMPAHTHTESGANATANGDREGNARYAKAASGTTGTTGGGQSHSHGASAGQASSMMPYIAMHQIMAV